MTITEPTPRDPHDPAWNDLHPPNTPTLPAAGSSIPVKPDQPEPDSAPEPADHPLSLRERVRLAMRQDGLTEVQLAEALSVSKSAINNWLSARSGPGTTAMLDEAARVWLERRDRAMATRHPAEHEPFVETASSERIASALAYAQSYRDMVAVYGGPGTGKTRTLFWYRGQYESVWIVTATPAVSTVVPALEEVAEAIGITDPQGGARRLSRQIRAKVRNTGGLLIVDEAQHLSMAAVEELRSIHDAVKVGLALVGNETSYARFTTGNRAPSFAQINSRLGLKLYLRRPRREDVLAIAASWQVTDEKALALLERVSQRPGALRSVTKVLRLAGAGTAKAITLARIRAAVDNLGAEA